MIQELLNIRKDMRIQPLEVNVVFSYWRVLDSKEWKPTSTSNGSSLVFEKIPKKWEKNLKYR